MVTLRSLAFLAVPFLLAACSSSGRSGSDARGAGGATLVLDTAAGGDYALDGRVDALAFERADGTFTVPLLPPGADLALVRPSGATSGVHLSAVPAGTYVAVRLLLAENGVRATGRNGVVEPCQPATRDVRAPFAAPTAVVAGSWLVLSHAGRPAVSRTGAQLAWQPDLVVRLGDVQPLAEVGFLVATRQGDDLVGTLSSCGDMVVRGRLDDSTDLSDDSGPRDRRSFLDDSRGGDDLVCDGVLDNDGTFQVRRAHRRSRGLGEGKAYGEIAALLPSTLAIQVQVQEIVRSTQGLATSPLPVLTVETASAFVYRSGARTVRLEFAALAVGQRVEVEWRGAVVGNAVSAHEVEIEDGYGGGGFGHEIEGAVGSVSPATGELVAVPRGDDPLVVGGQSVPSAVVVVGAHTVIVREAGDRRQPVTLAQVQVGDRVWVWGRVVEPQRVEAVAVRVRAR